jgi:hypothetical protein
VKSKSAAPRRGPIQLQSQKGKKEGKRTDCPVDRAGPQRLHFPEDGSGKELRVPKVVCAINEWPADIQAQDKPCSPCCYDPSFESWPCWHPYAARPWYHFPIALHRNAAASACPFLKATLGATFDSPHPRSSVGVFLLISLQVFRAAYTRFLCVLLVARFWLSSGRFRPVHSFSSSISVLFLVAPGWM